MCPADLSVIISLRHNYVHIFLELCNVRDSNIHVHGSILNIDEINHLIQTICLD